MIATMMRMTIRSPMRPPATMTSASMRFPWGCGRHFGDGVWGWRYRRRRHVAFGFDGDDRHRLRFFLLGSAFGHGVLYPRSALMVTGTISPDVGSVTAPAAVAASHVRAYLPGVSVLPADQS